MDDDYVENEEFLSKVTAIAKQKYEIEDDVLTGFMWEINQCYLQNFTPRRTVEVVACHLFE